jgi:haloalkane dehalogenase
LRDAVADRRLIASDLSPRFLEPLVNDRRRLAGALAVIGNANPSDFDAIALIHPKLTAPVRLVWGVRDPWFPLSGARAMLKTFGGPATLTEVPDAGLLVHEEAPHAVARAIQELAVGMNAGVPAHA